MQSKKMKNDIASLIAFLILAVLPFVFSCGGNRAETSSVEEPEVSGDDSFEEFYKRFHKDSAFQMEHITFPLQGLPMMADSFLINYGTFFYEKEGWKILQEVDWDTAQNFVRTLEYTGLDIINEFICTHDNFCIARRFAKLHDGWYLVYYSDLNYRGGGF